MSSSSVPWNDRIDEFAPVIGLHKHHMFFPTEIEAFLEESCELMVIVDVERSGRPIYGRVKQFADAPLDQKFQWLLRPKMNKRINFLDRHGGEINMRKSARLLQGRPQQLYVRGFREQNSGNAYIIYWFFYVENFVPRSTNDDEIAEILNDRPDSWWSHEGDWEAVSVRFDDFAGAPAEVIFSQHNTAEVIPWNSVVKDGGRVLAIPAIGSHAVFNQPVRKKRFITLAEVASADVLLTPLSVAVASQTPYTLVELDPVSAHLWLHFKGMWGQSAGEFEKAPTGPLMKRRKHFTLLADIGQSASGSARIIA